MPSIPYIIFVALLAVTFLSSLSCAIAIPYDPQKPTLFSIVGPRTAPQKHSTHVDYLLNKRTTILNPADPSDELELEPGEVDAQGYLKCGDYKIKIGDKIAAGGEGIVYKATTDKGVEMAIKSSDQTRALKAEAKLLMNTLKGNQHIMQVFASCDLGLNWGMLMELNSGTMQDNLQAKKYVGNSDLVKNHMTQVLDAITFIHSKGYAHNDLNPVNIMFHADGTVRVIDFGGAKKHDKALATLDVVPDWRSPEASTGDKIDTFLNDEWALATITAALLLGQQPWHSATDANAVAIWNAPATAADRSVACKREWPSFSTQFCDVLSNVFAPQDQRKDMDTFVKGLAGCPNLLA